MPLLGILECEVCVKAAAIFRLKRSAFDHSVWRVLEKASLPFADMVNKEGVTACNAVLCSTPNQTHLLIYTFKTLVYFWNI